MAHLPPQQLIEVQAESQPNRASVELADVEMEQYDHPSGEEEQLDTADPKVDGSRILIVDDNPDLRAYVSTILREQDIEFGQRATVPKGFRALKPIARN